MDKAPKMQKEILCYLGIIIMFVLLGNSNNTPEVFIEKIFKPIKGNGWIIHYAGLIAIVGIYYCLRQLNEIKERYLIKTTFKRVVATIVLISVFSVMWVYCIQFYKGFFNNLNSIYLDRDKTSVQFSKNEYEITVNGTIDVVNCSNSIQKFRIKIKTPPLAIDGIEEEYISLEEEFEVQPKEEKRLVINKEIKPKIIDQGSEYTSSAFEYVLFNDKDEVVFKGTLEQYHFI